VQQAVAARDAAIEASIASRPAPVKRPVGRPKVLAPLGASPSRRQACVGRAATQVEWGGAPGALASSLHSSSSSSSSRSPEAEEAGSVCLHLRL